MAYTNSKLVSYTKISPNRTSPRNHVIDTITIHCVVGQCSVQSLGNVFASPSRKASSNYGIGYDGKVGMYVEEKDRSWCSSSASNDNRAVTIEVASDTTHPYAVTDKALAALIELVADICKRNNIKELKWKGDKSLIGQVSKQNMTVHRWFANKSCPGDYLYNRHTYIANEVNKRLNGSTSTVTKPTTTTKAPTSSTAVTNYSTAIKSLADKGIIDTPSYWADKEDDVKYLGDLMIKVAKAAQSKKVNSFTDVNKAINHLVECEVINSPSYWMANYSKVKYLDNLLIKVANYIEPDSSYKVKVTANELNVRKGAGTNYGIVTSIKDKGVYTIVEEKMNGNTKWGLLKSYEENRNGWISLAYTKRV